MFCLTYYPQQQQKNYYKDVEELKIEYRPADRTLEDFIRKYQDKSIVIDLSKATINDVNETDIKLFSGLYEKYKNIKLMFYWSLLELHPELFHLINDYKIPFFFSDFVNSIDFLHTLLPYHPTDMYICEELCFSIDRVSKLLHDNNVKVRIFPNICQASGLHLPGIKTFFVRPEDIPIYSKYVDVFELIADLDRQRVIYKVYKQEKWFGKINEIIPSFKGELDNRYLLESFGMFRTKCGKKCFYDPSSCGICDRFLELEETLKENGIIIYRDKKKDN